VKTLAYSFSLASIFPSSGDAFLIYSLFIPSGIPTGFLDPFAEQADEKLRDHFQFR
jgi:hypothetical protein